MARILIAPDKFKGTLSAEEVADEVASAVRRIVPTLPGSWTPSRASSIRPKPTDTMP